MEAYYFELRPYFYSPAARDAAYRYRQNNLEAVRAYMREYYKNRYATDPEFREGRKQAARERYHRKVELAR